MSKLRSKQQLKLTKKQAIAISVTAAAVLIASVAAYFSLKPAKPPRKSASVLPKPVSEVKAAPQQPEAYDPLSGLPTAKELASRRPLAVMIENYYPDARPQSGLDKASLVFEAVAEGGITRFMAVFTAQNADVVGPIRSNREYYVKWAKGLGAIYVHCGGSPGGYGAISALGVDSIDEIGWPAGFWRSSDRRAPHNLYSSTEGLREQARIKGYATATEYAAYRFKDDPPPAERPSSQSATIDFSTAAYRVKYVYQQDSNSYLRYMGGEPHVDAVSGKQLVVKNIAVMYTRIWPLNDDENRMGIETEGMGRAVILQDGRAVPATWKRGLESELPRFYDSNDQEIKFNRGQTWIEVTDRQITNSP